MARPESNLLAKDTGRVQTAALGVLCALAVMQLGLLGWSAWEAMKESGEEKGPKVEVLVERPGSLGGQVEREVEAPELSMPPRPGELAGVKGAPVTGVVSGLMPPVPGMLAGEGPEAGVGSAPLVPAGGGVASLPTPDPEVAELLQTVAQLRAGGETEGLMELLKAAEGMDQNHPAVLKEFALTYEQMGLTEKAREYWERIVGLGEAVSGMFYGLAQQRLERLGAGAPSAVFPAGPAAILTEPNVVGGMPLGAGSEMTTARVTSEAGAALGVGGCKVVRDLAVAKGDKRTLRIPIVRVGASPIEPEAVNVDVFFYDRVNGTKVEPTRADPPVSSWAASPVDWSGEGMELLDVTYFLPPMSAQEQLDHGRRDFHGYLVKLYYQDRLQAVVAEPRELLEESPGSTLTAPSTLRSGR
jgi:hypothetical protein